MRMVDIKKQSNKYIIETVILVVLVNLLWTFAKQIWPLDVFAPMMASMIFVLVVEITSALVWRWVMQKHHEMLPSFFTGVSSFRFLGALLLITIWFLVVGREQIMTFIMVFFAYYLVTLIHHSIFFSRVSHRV